MNRFLLLPLLLPLSAAAQPMANMPGMAPTPPVPPAAPTAPKIPGTAAYVNPATQAYKQSMDKMMSGMDAPYVNESDQDFVTHMAEIELKYGTDPKLKQLAARIISAQQHEIAFMQAWLAKNPYTAPSGPPHAQWK